ncbi:MAG: hypothetical protein ABJA49_06600 [Betaproteobacteria bacterium]
MSSKKSDRKSPRHAAHDVDTSAWHAQLAEDRSATLKPDAPGTHPVGGLSSAASVSADPYSREKALGMPVQQTTRKI